MGQDKKTLELRAIINEVSGGKYASASRRFTHIVDSIVESKLGDLKGEVIKKALDKDKKESSEDPDKKEPEDDGEKKPKSNLKESTKIDGKSITLTGSNREKITFTIDGSDLVIETHERYPTFTIPMQMIKKEFGIKSPNDWQWLYNCESGRAELDVEVNDPNEFRFIASNGSNRKEIEVSAMDFVKFAKFVAGSSITTAQIKKIFADDPGY